MCSSDLNTVNSSLSSGHVPSSLKLASVTPVLKKPGLDPDSPNNYSPISNRPFLSKILERVVAKQLITYLDTNDLFELFQSGFRSKHSTETALLKLTNELLLSSDTGSLNILILLDLSATHTPFLSDLILGLSTVKMPVTPKFISPAQNSPLDARLLYRAACSSRWDAYHVHRLPQPPPHSYRPSAQAKNLKVVDSPFSPYT